MDRPEKQFLTVKGYRKHLRNQQFHALAAA